MEYKITKKHIRSIIKEYVDDYAEDLLSRFEPESTSVDKYEEIEKDFRGIMVEFLKKHSHKFEDGKWSVLGVIDTTLDKYFK